MILNRLFPLILIGLSSCSRCENTNPISDAQTFDTADSVTDKIISGDTWSLTFPISWNVDDFSSYTGIVLSMNQPVSKGFLILRKEKYSNTFDQFAIESLRDLREQDSVLHSTSKVIINGFPFIFADTTSYPSLKKDMRILLWATVYNGFGYKLSCGGPHNEPQSISDCNKIANSLILR